jgi:hypothetical protein
MFRNFMTNELGITREDIKLWTQEAIKESVDKLVGQIDVEGIVGRRVSDNVSATIRQSLGRSDLGILLRTFGYNISIEKKEETK